MYFTEHGRKELAFDERLVVFDVPVDLDAYSGALAVLGEMAKCAIGSVVEVKQA